MAEIDDLKLAVTKLTPAVSDVATELKAVADALLALKGQPVISAADVETAAVSISGFADSLTAAVAAAKAETGV